MLLNHCYTDMLLHWILLHGYSVHYYFLFMSHWYKDTLIHAIPSFHILVSSLDGCSVHSYIMFTHHCYIYSLVYMHWLILYSCYTDHRSYCMYIHVSLLHDCFPLLIFPLLDTSAVDMRCLELNATWISATGATSRIPYLLYIVSHYLISWYQ